MRVKRLEIQGFKSFKDKTVIHFDHSITGIVGPNGCGKSNIVDAFFWVMGEQSYKHMRGTGSEDLIFNGSTKYAPLGFAEATLVLETDYEAAEAAAQEEATAADADANGATGDGAVAAGPAKPVKDVPLHLRAKEIAVTRRVYRTGEGEYFINGTPARLKDIHELFMDTGVGAKGYSVIEQGQIGKIVNAKPEERRLLIEEAAGIAKYKARKKESLKKMEATHANLSRLNDVIQEIERSLGSLERQAQKAQQYKRYKDELLDKEMTWGRRKNQVLRQKLEELRAQRDTLEQELAGLRAELQVTENSIETDRVEQLTRTKIAEDLQSRIQDLSSELTREKSALDLSRRRQGDLASQLEALEQEREELESSIGVEKERLQDLETETQNAAAEFEAAATQAQAMDQATRTLRRETDDSRRALDQAKRSLMQGISEASDLTSRAASLDSRAESAKAQAERLASQVETLSARVETAREEAEKARVIAAEVQANKAQLQTEKKEQQEKNQELEQSVKKLDREKDDANRKLTQLKSRLQSLEELAQAHEGFGNGPKAVLDWSKSNNAEIRAVADGFEVSAGYESALEGLLEGSLENLISENPANALKAITKLSSDKQGRAAIHLHSPASTIKAPAFTAVQKVLSDAGFEIVGELSEFVSINKKLSKSAQEIASSLIQNVCVVKSCEPIEQLIATDAIAKIPGWSIVSIDGAAYDQDGTLRGGSTKANPAATLLGRKRAIADLQTQVAESEAVYATIEEQAAEARDSLDIARARLQTLQSDLQSLEVQAAGLDRDVHQTARTLKDIENQLENSESEMSELQEEIETATRNRLEIDEKIQEIISSRSDLEGSIAEQENALSTYEAQLRSKETELNSMRVQEAQLRERSNSVKRELEAGQKLITDRQRRLVDVTKILERATMEREQHSGGDSDSVQKIEDLTKELGETRAELAGVKDQLEQSSAKLNGALERIKTLHHQGDSKTAQSNQIALEVEKISAELTHLIQNLEEKYGPGCLENSGTSPIQEEMTEPVITQEMTAEEERVLGEEVERLRERIRRLGEVNVMAIQEFEELKKRYDYLLTEKSDLERSIENLQQAIEHINKTSEERFRKAYEAIADRFERLFPIIFGGGLAKLSLIYPEGSNDILEAGVDILAQPPGKKVVNITLLSGGEKALTAVSLIFAIFMVKPSPFCVLDEVDAPLDDANIGKFNALLKEMSAKSQFILITHNKKTMELNDTLYGVTMEEPGVSKMVSIEMH